MNVEKEYLLLHEAADYLGVSRVKLSRMIKEGLIPYTTSPLDKRVKLFKRADLDTFLSQVARVQKPAGGRSFQR